MSADLDVDGPEIPCPVGKQPGSNSVMDFAYPLGSNMDVFRGLIDKRLNGLRDGYSDDFATSE
jgi:hypothetical protein